MERRIESRQTLTIITLFLVAQFSGLLLAVLAASSSQIYIYPLTQGQTTGFLPFFVIYLAAFSLLIIVVFRFLKKELLMRLFGWFFRFLEWALILIGTTTAVSIILSYLFPESGTASTVLAAAFGVFLIILKSFRPRMRNIATLVSSTGFGVLLGFYGFSYAYVFAALIAVYDYISVFVTKHMITIAEQVSSQNLAFMISSSEVEVVPSSFLKKSDRAELKKSAMGAKDPYIKKLLKGNKLPVLSRAALGNGDIIIPIMLAVGAYVSYLNYYLPVIIIICAGLGMVATMMVLKRYKVPLPAIPPLFAFINLGLAAGYIVMNPGSTKLILSFFLIFVSLNAVLLLTLNRIRRKQGV
ncbi:MAG: hypothetical protein KGH74_05105 [Candidatus Micrarchaeota archaeon]|nr:hypothetical protein [Candidatus Micrarchaeota archaeon]